jgi:hypothetical protein
VGRVVIVKLELAISIVVIYLNNSTVLATVIVVIKYRACLLVN